MNEHSAETDSFPATLGPPHHHEDERECFTLRADPTKHVIWRHESGRAGHPDEMCDRVHPCVDKACVATSAASCRYPGWDLCGHPTPTGETND